MMGSENAATSTPSPSNLRHNLTSWNHKNGINRSEWTRDSPAICIFHLRKTKWTRDCTAWGTKQMTCWEDKAWMWRNGCCTTSWKSFDEFFMQKKNVISERATFNQTATDHRVSGLICHIMKCIRQKLQLWATSWWGHQGQIGDSLENAVGQRCNPRSSNKYGEAIGGDKTAADRYKWWCEQCCRFCNGQRAQAVVQGRTTCTGSASYTA